MVSLCLLVIYIGMICKNARKTNPQSYKIYFKYSKKIRIFAYYFYLIHK